MPAETYTLVNPGEACGVLAGACSLGAQRLVWVNSGHQRKDEDVIAGHVQVQVQVQV